MAQEAGSHKIFAGEIDHFRFCSGGNVGVGGVCHLYVVHRPTHLFGDTFCSICWA